MSYSAFKEGFFEKVAALGIPAETATVLFKEADLSESWNSFKDTFSKAAPNWGEAFKNPIGQGAAGALGGGLVGGLTAGAPGALIGAGLGGVGGYNAQSVNATGNQQSSTGTASPTPAPSHHQNLETAGVHGAGSSLTNPSLEEGIRGAADVAIPGARAISGAAAKPGFISNLVSKVAPRLAPYLGVPAALGAKGHLAAYGATTVGGLGLDALGALGVKSLDDSANRELLGNEAAQYGVGDTLYNTLLGSPSRNLLTSLGTGAGAVSEGYSNLTRDAHSGLNPEVVKAYLARHGKFPGQ